MRTAEQILYDCVISEKQSIKSDSLVSENAAKSAILKAGKEMAVLFGKWISSNGYQQYDEPDRWISQEVSGNTVFTTEQLYNKFLGS